MQNSPSSPLQREAVKSLEYAPSPYRSAELTAEALSREGRG
jgi:hypothetical protein